MNKAGFKYYCVKTVALKIPKNNWRGHILVFISLSWKVKSWRTGLWKSYGMTSRNTLLLHFYHHLMYKWSTPFLKVALLPSIADKYIHSVGHLRTSYWVNRLLLRVTPEGVHSPLREDGSRDSFQNIMLQLCIRLWIKFKWSMFLNATLHCQKLYIYLW